MVFLYTVCDVEPTYTEKFPYIVKASICNSAYFSESNNE